MTRVIVLLVLLFGGIWMAPAAPASAADMKAGAQVARYQVWRYSAPPRVLPFPRSERAASVWASDACWSDCQSFCTWGEAACLQADVQGRCLKWTDRCDRACQRDCRTRGGPLLPVEFPWE